MAKPVSNLRLFVAIHPPADGRMVGAMMQAISDMALPSYKPTPPEQVHLTLQFIGDTPAGEVEDVMESVRRSAAGIGSFALIPQRLISLPHRGPVRLVAMETDVPSQVLELHRRLAHRLATKVRERERDRFLPHFTLCRFRSPTIGVKINEPVTMEPISVPEIRLMRSVLLPTGAEHRELMRCELNRSQ